MSKLELKGYIEGTDIYPKYVDELIEVIEDFMADPIVSRNPINYEVVVHCWKMIGFKEEGYPEGGVEAHIVIKFKDKYIYRKEYVNRDISHADTEACMEWAKSTMEKESRMMRRTFVLGGAYGMLDNVKRFEAKLKGVDVNARGGYNSPM